MRALKALFALGLAGWMCSFCLFVTMQNLLVASAIPQLPFGDSQLAQWQLDIPQYSDTATGTGSVGAGATAVAHDGYISADAQAPRGLPPPGPIKHFCKAYDMALSACPFMGPNFPDAL